MAPQLVCEASLSGHVECVWCIAWHPSGNLLASCSGDKSVRIWQRAENLEGGARGSGTWDCAAVIDGVHSRTVRSVCWSPCGGLLAVGSFDATVSLWSLRTGKDENSHMDFQLVCTLEGHEHEVKALSWSHDGKYLVSSSRDKTAWIWNVGEEARECVDFDCAAVLVGHAQDVKGAQWSDSSEEVVTCSYDNTIRTWVFQEEECDWEPAEVLEGHESTVWEISYESGASERFASCSSDESVIIWKTEPDAGENGTPRRWVAEQTITCHQRPIYSIDWSTAGKIATGGGDNRICVLSENGDGEFVPLVTEEQSASGNGNLHHGRPRRLHRNRACYSAGTPGEHSTRCWRRCR